MYNYPMYTIVGLGNPGQKYQNNRHNVGQIFIDYVIKKLRITNYELKVVKTDVFMNQSGVFVKKLIRNPQFVINNLIIAHDDLDIPLGKFKIQKGQGPRLHNGIISIENVLSTNDFWRIRIGVDNRPARRPDRQNSDEVQSLNEDRQTNRWIDGETYVLSDFTPEEKIVLNATFPKIYQQLFNQILNRNQFDHDRDQIG